MNQNLEMLKKIEIIFEVKECFLTDEIKQKIEDTELIKRAEKNAEKLNVYKMIYISQGHKVVGYIVEPKGNEKIPCIIYNRGGSNEFGAIKIGQLFLDKSRFALNGYISIFTQYSGNSGSEGKDEFGGSDIEDVLNLYKILNMYPRADIKKVGMYGASRGGLMTYLSLSKVKWLRAAVASCAPSNEVEASRFRKGWEEHQKKMFGGSMKEKIKRSAVYWADKFCKKTPLLIMHGTADWRVNPLDSIKLAEKLYQNKIPFKLIIFEGADHIFTECKTEEIKQTLDWFDRFLKNDEKLPNLKPH